MVEANKSKHEELTPQQVLKQLDQNLKDALGKMFTHSNEFGNVLDFKAAGLYWIGRQDKDTYALVFRRDIQAGGDVLFMFDQKKPMKVPNGHQSSQTIAGGLYLAPNESMLRTVLQDHSERIHQPYSQVLAQYKIEKISLEKFGQKTEVWAAVRTFY